MFVCVMLPFNLAKRSLKTSHTNKKAYSIVCEVKRSGSVVSDSLHPHGLVAYHASPSMGFSRQEYWSGLLFPSPEQHGICRANWIVQ